MKTLLTMVFLLVSVAGAQMQVREQGLVANLYLPQGRAGRVPGVILLAGSDGGFGRQDSVAQVLAKEGFAALAVAYFGLEGLPPELDRIPLEYFAAAVKYLQAQPQVNPKKIALTGYSKGGEAALLLASRMPEIRAVVAFVPSSVVWQGIAKGFPKISSWSERGQPLPFVPYVTLDRSIDLRELYTLSLRQEEAVRDAAIPVERIRGPVLLLSGRDDKIWPSTEMCEGIVARLKSKRFRRFSEHVAYDKAGHGISYIRDNVTRLGGTEEGNRHAQIDGQQRMLAFLKKYL